MKTKKTILKTPKTKQQYLTAKDKATYKDKIISDLFNSNVIQKKIEGMFFREGIHKTSDLVNDFTNETFLELSKKTPDYIIEIFERDVNKLVGLCVTICKRRGFIPSHNRTDLPSASWKQFYMHGSNINQLSYYSPIEEDTHDNESSKYHQQYVLSEERNPIQEVFEGVRIHLTDNQKDLLEHYFNITTKQAVTKAEQERINCYEALVNKISTVIKENQLWN